MTLTEWCILCYIVFLDLAKVHSSFLCMVLAKSNQSESLFIFLITEIKVEVITLFKNLMLILILSAIFAIHNDTCTCSTRHLIQKRTAVLNDCNKT